MRWLSWLIVLSGIGSDQVTKMMILNRLTTEGQSIPVCPHFNLTLVFNPGVSFGLLAMPQPWGSWVLIILTSLITVGLLVWMCRLREKHLVFALALVTGGAIGNLMDRVRWGHVVDFLDVYYKNFHWPAFNVADSMICLGIIILIWSQIVFRKNEEHHVK